MKTRAVENVSRPVLLCCTKFLLFSFRLVHRSSLFVSFKSALTLHSTHVHGGIYFKVVFFLSFLKLYVLYLAFKYKGLDKLSYSAATSNLRSTPPLLPPHHDHPHHHHHIFVLQGSSHYFLHGTSAAHQEDT